MIYDTVTVDDPEEMRVIVEAAEATRLALDARPRVEGARLRHAAELVKGRNAIGDALARGGPSMSSVAVIPCQDYGQANAIKLACGEAEGSA